MFSTFTGSGDLMFFMPVSRMDTSRGRAVQPWVVIGSFIVVMVGCGKKRMWVLWRIVVVEDANREVGGRRPLVG